MSTGDTTHYVSRDPVTGEETVHQWPRRSNRPEESLEARFTPGPQCDGQHEGNLPRLCPGDTLEFVATGEESA